MNKGKLLDFLNGSMYFFVVIIIAFFIIKYIGQRTEVVGSSMEPPLIDAENLIDDLLAKIGESSPSFFEHLVVDLLVHMGYGFYFSFATHLSDGFGNVVSFR